MERFQQRIRNDPAWYIREFIGPEHFWDGQERIVRYVLTHNRVAVGGCVSSSKTFAAAMAVLTWLAAYTPSRAFTFAPSGRQVDANLWGDIRILHRNAKRPLGGKLMPKESRWDIDHDWYALGFATDAPENVHGIHGPNDLLVLDDAHGVKQDMHDEIENARAGGNTHLLYLFNPVVVSGRVFDAATGRLGPVCQDDACPGCDRIKVYMIASKDTPNVKTGKVVIPGMVTLEQDQAWRREFGPDSNFVRTKLDAKWPLQEPDTLIPMDWIELAMNRVVPVVAGPKVYGQDVAWDGDDDSVCAPMVGRQVGALEVVHGADPMKVADCLDTKLAQPGAFGYVDGIGIGAGVYSREAQRKRNVTCVIVSENAVGQHEGKPAADHFYNLRAQIAWTLREALDPNNPEAIALPRDMELQAEMSAIKFFIDERTGKLRIESKKEIKKRLHYSPDKFDAVALAVWGRFLLLAQVDISRWATEQAAAAVHVQSETARGLDFRDEDEPVAQAVVESETLAGLERFDD